MCEAWSNAKHIDALFVTHHDVRMRTTLTLDDDVAQVLRETARNSGRSFKEVVNETLRHGLATDATPIRRVPRFRVQPKACGFRAGIDLKKLNHLVDEREIERAGPPSIALLVAGLGMTRKGSSRASLPARQWMTLLGSEVSPMGDGDPCQKCGSDRRSSAERMSVIA